MTPDHGVGAVRIDPIAASLGVTKGSFFHHFDSAAALRAAVLDAYRTSSLDLVAELRSRIAGMSVPGALTALTAAVGTEIDLSVERAVRAWAASDASAAEAVAEVDAARLELLQGVWVGATDPENVRRAALIPHLALIGALSSPDITTADLRIVLDLLIIVAGAVPGADAG